MLVGNRSTLLKSPGRFLSGGPVSVMRSAFNTHGMMRGAYGGNYNALSATPDGHLSPSAWVLPKTAGGMSSRNTINGAATATGNGNLGLPAAASLSGSGGITQALLALVVSAVANLSGSGTLTAGIIGKLEAAAALAGSGNLAGAAGALASMLVGLSGSGAAVGTPYASGSMSANIKGYGDLTPEGIRDSIWNALAANYNTAGTMGNKLNSAASGGVDYAALGEAVWAILLADANNPGSMGEFVQDLSGGGASGLTLAQFLALK